MPLTLPFRTPLAWDSLWRFFADRAIPGVEHAQQGVYTRSLRLDGAPGFGLVRVRALETELEVELAWQGPAPLPEVQARLRHLFDLDLNPEAVSDALWADAELRKRGAGSLGIRVPGVWDGFETAVRAILGQQISVKAATRLAQRMVQDFGEPLPEDVATAEITHAFPTAQTLAEADLGGLPLPGSRQRAVACLATEVAAGRLRLDPTCDLGRTRARLRTLPGVGDWTTEYIAMRALGDPDAFPSSDLVLRRTLGLDTRALKRRAEAWRPWRAYAALLLWSNPRLS